MQLLALDLDAKWGIRDNSGLYSQNEGGCGLWPQQQQGEGFGRR